MKRTWLVMLLLALGVPRVSVTVLAHHGNAAYADNVTEFTQATVTKFAWVNPHSLIGFDAKDPKGGIVHMVVETAAPQALTLIGWSKAVIAPGDVITVRMYVAKNGNPVGRLQKIVLADGTELHDTQLGGDAGGKTRYDPDAPSSPQH